MKILLVVNALKDADFSITNTLIKAINGRGGVYMHQNCMTQKLEKNVLPLENISEIDYIFVLGGDGTLLSVAQLAAEHNIPVAGINLGRLGFMTDIDKNKIHECMDLFFSGRFTVEERMMLKAETTGQNNAEALNDVVITRENSALKILELCVYIDGVFVDDFKADGLIVSTPTGSTAYSLSAGGPIIDPAFDALLITPICPHKMYSRAIIVPPHRKVCVVCKPGADNEAVVAADSAIFGNLGSGEKITIACSDKRLPLIRMEGTEFFSVLHRKLINKES